MSAAPSTAKAVTESVDAVQRLATKGARACGVEVMVQLVHACEPHTSLAGHCNDRERAFAAALCAWSEGRMRVAAGYLEAYTTGGPLDALAVRVLHDIYFLLG